MGNARVTTDHELIRRWTKERGGFPATVKAPGDEGKLGALKIVYPGFSGEERVERITWEEFFDAFDHAFLCQQEAVLATTKLTDRDPTEEACSTKA